jgi:hypothetical protein
MDVAHGAALPCWVPGVSDGAHGAHQFGLAGHLIAHAAHALELEDAAAHAVDRDVQNQLVARLHRALETRTVDAGEVVTVLSSGTRPWCRTPAGRRLGQRFQHQHARHDRAVREVPGEKGSLNVTFLMALMRLLSSLEHLVHQQERVAVRQLLENLVNVHHQRSILLFWRSLFQGLDALAQAVQLLDRGGVLFPARIVVDGKHAGVVARLVNASA